MKKAKKQIDRIFQAKQKRRKNLAKLPVEEKVRMLVQLQKIAFPILAQRGIRQKPWVI